jgi:hypothetical protein
MFIGHRKIGFLRIGRNPFTYRNRREISFGLCRREGAHEWQIPWRWHGSWAPNLPRLIYRVHRDISVSWTGREVTLAGIKWWGRVWFWG